MKAEYNPKLDAYSDRWNKIHTLFQEITHEKWIALDDSSYEFRPEPSWPRREWVHSHSGPQVGWDNDHMAGLHDWWQPHANSKEEHQPDIELQGKTINDSVTRDKIYIYSEGFEYSEEMLNAFPTLRYFLKMRDEFEEDVMEYSFQFMDQDIDFFKPCLMLVKYDVPDFVDYHSYMHWNFYKFGGRHADDNLGALHLGENSLAYFAEDNNVRFNIPELQKSHTFWTYGDYAKKSGYTPTKHGVEYWGGSGPRYSIIYNLECKYK